MTQPTYAQYKNLNVPTTNDVTLGAGLHTESIQERILTCLAVIVSQQNPDGTPYVA